MKILGNHIQIDLIKKLIEKKQFPNSLILSGQKGVGKSLIARNIAYCLVDCIKLDELNYINNLTSHDILFICKGNLEEKKQSKQLMSRDDISHISSFFKTKNDSHSKRVCIIDAIDDLSLDAINSLLKIIEEPNINSHFILISHDNKKLLLTIKSRSFLSFMVNDDSVVFVFGKLTPLFDLSTPPKTTFKHTLSVLLLDIVCSDIFPSSIKTRFPFFTSLAKFE